jgi:hypothetical protein
MLAILLMTLSSVTALVFIYFCLPALWRSLMIVDETLDAHEAGFTVVASRACFLNSNVSPFSFCQPGNPFRETGPPANMAKLILLRHKVGRSTERFAPF